MRLVAAVTILSLTLVLPAGASAAGIADAKAALTRGDVTAATRLLEQLTATGPDSTNADAWELLGLAYERTGSFDKARDAYGKSLQFVTDAAAKQRLRQRLDAMTAALEAVSKQKKWQSVESDDGAAASGKTSRENNAVLAAVPKPPRQALNTSLKQRLHIKDQIKDPAAWEWDSYGDIGQYYYLDKEIAPDSRLIDSTLISSGNYAVSGENERWKVTGRASAYNLEPLGGDHDPVAASVSAFYADILDKDTKAFARLGRQTKNESGIFGRFDGLDARANAAPNTEIGVTLGSPAYFRDQKPFADNRYFIGTHLTQKLDGTPFRGSIYALEQRVGKIVDRRALGVEATYNSSLLLADGYADYDVYYNKLNSAGLRGNWQMSDATTISATLDYQTVPFLLTTNALIGQDEDKLSGLVGVLGRDEVLMLAKDRTADAVTGSVGLSHEINSKWQMALDAMIAHYGGTPASGGVGALPADGTSAYFAAALNGSGIFRDGDSVSMSLRYSRSHSSDYYVADGRIRFPLSDKLRVGTRLRLGLRDSRRDAPTAFVVAPGFDLKYRVTPHWILESELGVEWNIMPGPDTADLLALLAYRYEF